MHVGLYQDETGAPLPLAFAEAHYLEAWGDARTYDGTASICQPLIEPLYGGRSHLEIAAFLATLHETPGEEIVQKYWRDHWNGNKKKSESDFSDFWKTSLHDGVVRDTALPHKSVQLKEDWQQSLHDTAARAGIRRVGKSNGIRVVRARFPARLDDLRRSFANNGWLQELPKPLTKLTWDNAALMSPATAKELGVGFGEYGMEANTAAITCRWVNVGSRRPVAPSPRVDHAGTCRSINHGVARIWPSLCGPSRRDAARPPLQNEVIQDAWGLIRSSQSPHVASMPISFAAQYTLGSCRIADH